MFFINTKKLSKHRIKTDDIANARAYVKKYWKSLLKRHVKDTKDVHGLPNPYLVPAPKVDGQEFSFEEMYYWDSYFMLQPFFDGKHKKLVIGMIENMVYLIKKFGMVPNSTSKYLSSRSQPPFLTTLAWQAYEEYSMPKSWLKKVINAAEKEYKTVWMGIQKPHARQVFHGLSRPYDINYLPALAETETGWDMTPRFKYKALDFTPVCLNSLLYKYEKDFERFYALMGDTRLEGKYKKAAHARKKTMTTYMWHERKGLFYDYNYRTGRKSNVSSLASYYTLWSGLATKKQAKRMVEELRRFEERGGLTATEGLSIVQVYPTVPPMQWAHPNGWAPLHFLVTEGLERYGHGKKAKKIAHTWLKTNLDWFNEHGVFIEKYNVQDPSEPPKDGVYPLQEGFGWTNAIFEVYSRKYVDKS